MVKKGIDISHHQGIVDFNAVKADDIDFVILREGYRLQTDRKFFDNVSGAVKAKLPIYGVYHFSYALNEKDAILEAQVCIRNLQRAGFEQNAIVFYDFEYDTVNNAKEKGVTLTPSDCRNFTKAFCDEIKRAGYIPGVYTNMDFYENWYDKETLDPYTLWLADYKEHPSIKCVFHQYTSSGSVSGIKGDVDMDYSYDENFKINEEYGHSRSRMSVVQLAKCWLGKNESDGSYRSIIDTYNSYSGPFPRGIKMDCSWPWCACTWSALAISLGYTDIMPIEISCGYLVDAAKKMGVWIENDAYVPSPGDAILYDWNDNGSANNTGWPDHVGVVEVVDIPASKITVIEGNCDNMVKRRVTDINGRYIRGFIAPKYTDDTPSISASDSKDIDSVAKEVIAGKWGSGNERKKALEHAGYDYKTVQNRVNQLLKESASGKDSNVGYATHKNPGFAGKYMTITDLNCRAGAGVNYPVLCVFPEGAIVTNYGYYIPNTQDWLYVVGSVDGKSYTGFCNGKYLVKQ